MITINSQTTQKSLLNTLLSALVSNSVYVNIESLPDFLVSIPSIKIFQYKIQNYPRPIFWHSSNKDILKLLSVTGLQVGFPQALTQNKPIYSKYSKNPTVINLQKKENSQPQTQQANYYQQSYNQQRQIESQSENRNTNQIVNLPQQTIKQSHFESEFGRFQFPIKNPQYKQNSSRQKNYFQNLGQDTQPSDFKTSGQTYKTLQGMIPNASEYLTNIQNSEYTEYNKIGNTQNLQEWIRKIEETKTVLNKNRLNQFETNQNWQKKPSGNLFQNPFLFRSFISICLVVAVFFLFGLAPSNIYKLEVSPTLQQESLDISLPENIFNKTKIDLVTKQKIETSGSESSLLTNRAVGKVSLVNSGTVAVDLEKESILLISEQNGLEYRQKTTDKDSQKITLSPKNKENNQLVDIEIQAVESGEKYNLEVDSSFRIFNFKGEALGSNFRAISKTPIKNGPQASVKTVSIDDLSLLRSKVESDFFEIKNKQLQSIKDKNQIISLNWIKQDNVEYIFSAKPGEKVSELSVEAKSNANIYFIDRQLLYSTVKRQIPNEEIKDVSLINSTFEGSKINATLYISYLTNPKINKELLVKNFDKETDYEQTKLDLNDKYPNIKKVQKETKGINLPFVIPRNNVIITEI